MKNKKTIFLFTFLLLPLTTYAAWWNPFTWKMFQKNSVVPQVQIETQKTPEEKINDLQKQLDDLKKQQATSTPIAIPTTTIPVVKKEVKKTSPIVVPVTPKVEADKTVIVDVCPEIEGIQTVIPTGYVKNGSGQCVLLSSQTQPQSQVPVQTEKNYYIDAKSRLRELIELEKSYGSFLQDTNSQLRSASLTLAGYNTGGLYGQARDGAIKLANSMISVNNSLLMKNKSTTASLETILESLNVPNGFVNERTFNSIPTPQSVQNDIEIAEKSINDNLSEVLKTLQFH